MKERDLNSAPRRMTSKSLVINMDWLISFLTKDDCDLDSVIMKPNFFMWLSAYKFPDLTPKAYKASLVLLSKAKTQGAAKTVHDIIKRTLKKRMPSKSKRWPFEDEIPVKPHETRAESAENIRPPPAVDVGNPGFVAEAPPLVRRCVSPAEEMGAVVVLPPPSRKPEPAVKGEVHHSAKVDAHARPQSKGTPLPRGWLQPEWLYNFSKVKGKLTTDVLDTPRFYNWLKKTQFPDLTKSQYRTSIRRLVDDMGPGYDNNKINKIDKGLSSVLREKIKEYGKRAWGFQKKLKKETEEKGSAWEGTIPYVQALPSRKRGRAHSNEYYLPCDIGVEPAKRVRGADKYMYPPVSYPRPFPVRGHPVEPPYLHPNGNVPAPVYGTQNSRSRDYAHAKIPLTSGSEEYSPYPRYHYPVVPRGHYPDPVHTTEAYSRYPYE